LTYLVDAAHVHHAAPGPPSFVAAVHAARALAGDEASQLDRPAAVCVCLPGRDSSAASILDDLHAQDVAAAVARRLDIAPFAIAAIGGGASYWHARLDGTDRLAMLLDEFLPLLSRMGLGAPRRPTAILGVSMGGYGALLAAVRRPRTFAAVVASSPAVWRTRAEQASAVPDAFDGPRDYVANDVFALASRLDGRRVRIDVGDADPFAPAVRRLRAVVSPRPAGGVGSGCHHVGFWAKVLSAQLAFVARRFGDRPQPLSGQRQRRG
jgi:S-formylglutathione hydrolase FrmB